METTQLITYLDTLLQANKIKDYCPNGLQVEGKSTILRLVTGVTASQALVDAAIEQGADALLVHHGYFWKGEPEPVVGMKRNRLKALLESDVNLIAYHLPLDVHPIYGNNAQLGKCLGLTQLKGLDEQDPFSIPMQGQFDVPIDGTTLFKRIENLLGRTPLWIQGHGRPIKRVAWCTGGGQSFIEMAAALGFDAFISGEVSEQTVHVAHEREIDFFAAGHHATERYGVKALGEHLAQQFGLDVVFIDVTNPV